MPVRRAGTRLAIEGLNEYISGMSNATRVNQQFRDSLRVGGNNDLGRAMQEAERRATSIIRGEAQIRASLSRAEAQERAQQARASAAQVIESERRATAAFRAELSQRQAAQRSTTAAPPPTAAPGLGALGGVARAGLGIGLGLLGVQGVQQVIGTAVELDQLRGQSLRTETALTALAGSGGQAAAAIRQIQSVAPGATTNLAAAQAATTIFTQKLNSSAVSLAEIAKAIAIIPQVSPSINNQADAIGQLTLFANSASFARADQLAVTAQDVKDRVKELTEAFPDLSESQIKAAATVQLVNERFSALGEKAAEQVTGIEKLSTAFANLKQTIAVGGIGPIDSFFGALASGVEFVQGQLDPRQTGVLRGGLDRRIESARSNVGPVNSAIAGVLGIQDDATTASRLEQLAAVQEQINAAFETGTPGIEKYLIAVNELVQNAVLYGNVTDAEQEQLRQLHADFLLAAAGVDEFTEAQKRQAQAQAEAAAALNLQELNDARTQVNQLAQEALGLFQQGAPGAEQLAGQLLELQGALATSATLSEEDAAALKELGAQHNIVAAAAGQSTGPLDAAAQAKLNDQAAAWQDVTANQALAEAIQAVANAQAGVSRGIVSNLSGLIGGGLINATQAGGLNARIQQQATAGFADIRQRGLTGDALTFATAQLNRQLTAPFRELEDIETRMTREAQEQHRAAQGASKEWNQAQKDAEKAAKATAKALEGVEGLFSPSKVTQQQLDIAAAGGDVNLPDDFLRRFRDVAEHPDKGFREDFGQAELEQARQALERIGVQPLEDLKGLFAQFEEAWANLSLFSDKENLSLINQQAVQDQLALQQKMEEGRKNIYELFGVAIDDATEAVSGGGGGVPPIDQEALAQRIQEAQQKFLDSLLGSLTGTTPDNGFVTPKLGDIGATAGLSSMSDQVRSSLGDMTVASEVLSTKINTIPPVVWENYIQPAPAWQDEIIPQFPAWQSELIPDFPGWDQFVTPVEWTDYIPSPDWDAILRDPLADLVRQQAAEQAAAGVTSSGAPTGAAGIGSSATTAPTVPSVVQQGLTSPPTSNSMATTNNYNLAVNTRQTAGSVIRDFAILRASAAP